MGHKNNFSTQFLWQSTNPATGFLPLNNNTADKGSVLTGSKTGTMSGTNVIYSNIINTQRMDNIGLEIVWTGTPTGTLEIQGSNSGINFDDISISLIQPAGSAGGYLVNLNQYPFAYILIKYTNISGSGTLTIYPQFKDLN